MSYWTKLAFGPCSGQSLPGGSHRKYDRGENGESRGMAAGTVGLLPET